MKRIVVLLWLLVLLSGCRKKDISITTNYFPSEFETIRIEDSFNIILSEDTIYKLEVTGSENSVDNINIEVIDSELSISYSGQMKFIRPKEKITIRIFAPSFQTVFLSGGGAMLSNDGELTSQNIRINCENKGNSCELTINNKAFTFVTSGSGGEFKFSGKTTKAKFVYYDMVKIDAKNMNSENVTIRSYSTLDAEIYAAKTIFYSINDEGSILVYGNPNAINKQFDNNGGTGKLILK